jgi:hypothetical protein
VLVFPVTRTTVDQSKYPVSLLLEKDHILVTKHLLHTQSPS